MKPLQINAAPMRARRMSANQLTANQMSGNQLLADQLSAGQLSASPWLLLVAALLAVAFMFSTAPVQAEVNSNTMWRDAVITEMNVDFGGTGFHASYRFERCACGDLLIKAEQVAPDSVESGELLMIDGQTLLARGFEGQGNNIAPLVQAPLLMLQLTDALLNRSQPKGPNAVEASQQWDEEEPKIDFNLNTGFATGTFAAPWSVTGTAWKAAEGKRRFELVFKFVSPAPDDPDATSYISFSGDLDYRKQEFPLQAETVLDGWHLQRFAAGEDESKLVSGGLTLKQLREEAAAN